MLKTTLIPSVQTGIIGPQPATARPSERSEGPKEFDHALERALDRERIRLSKHARERIHSRRIDIDESDVSRISDAMSALQGKGGKISLLFMGGTTLLTNVENRTVITAVDRYGEAEKVFTNIDSAAVIEKA